MATLRHEAGANSIHWMSCLVGCLGSMQGPQDASTATHKQSNSSLDKTQKPMVIEKDRKNFECLRKDFSIYGTVTFSENSSCFPKNIRKLPFSRHCFVKHEVWILYDWLTISFCPTHNFCFLLFCTCITDALYLGKCHKPGKIVFLRSLLIG